VFLVSVFPHSGHAHKADSYLTGPDNKPIRSWGIKVISVCFGGHTSACEFVLAAVSRPILGVDFLARHKLLVDATARRVLFAASLLPLATTAATSASGCRSPFLTAVSTFSSEIRSLLAAYPAVISDGQSRPQPRHGVEHVVTTEGQPIFSKDRLLNPDKLRAAEA
jgi:hypothetical protein